VPPRTFQYARLRPMWDRRTTKGSVAALLKLGAGAGGGGRSPELQKLSSKTVGVTDPKP
jgi:hypothetical protein